MVLFSVCAYAQSEESRSPQGIPFGSEQLIVVTTDTWAATSGTLQRFERADGMWEPVSDLAQVVVGRSGLGWGVGLHTAPARGPVKREGDGRAPAGMFALTQTFGYADSVATGLPYLQATPDVECVDDSESVFYNRVVNRTAVSADWTSHEEMLRRDDLYRLGVEVAHNPQAVPRGGSCIFLHIWRGPAATTSGCTAMASEEMEAVAAWLRDDKGPVLVQLPQPEYQRLRAAWKLP